MEEKENFLAEAKQLMEEMGSGATGGGAVRSNKEPVSENHEESAVGGPDQLDANKAVVVKAAEEDDDTSWNGTISFMDPLTAAAASMKSEAYIAHGKRPSMISMKSIHNLEEEKVENPTVSMSQVRATASSFATSISSFAQMAATTVAQAATDAAEQTANALDDATKPTEVPRLVPVELDQTQKDALIKHNVGNMLQGERVIMFLANLLNVSDSSGYEYSGSWICCMTFYRLILFRSSPPEEEDHIPTDWDEDCWKSQMKRPTMIQMPLASVERVEKFIYTTSEKTNLMGLAIFGKDNFREIRFTAPSYDDTSRILKTIQSYSYPGRQNLGYLFAFESKRVDVMNSVVIDSTGKKSITLPPTPKRFDPMQEFRRQFGHMNPCPWNLYKQINSKDYSLCSSYPAILVGPVTLPEEQQDTWHVLRQSSAFRSEERLPVLTWSSGKDGASIWRSSQPRVGLQGNRSQGDEYYIYSIMESAALAKSKNIVTPSKQSIQKLTGKAEGYELGSDIQMKILDLRPRTSAFANRTQGYGYENTTNYPGTTLQFCNIGNIHAVQDAYTKLSKLCHDPIVDDTTWASLIEDTKWLALIRMILSAAWETAFWVHLHRLPVLLHCSHGWDRTSQVVSIAQLLLDPYYRSIEGFECLIEKDFLSFGHPFHTRCGHGDGRGMEQGGDANDQISPIFIQFLDCVWQLVKLFPEKFEFNGMYLLVLSEHVYSCRFGTLMCDTEYEREVEAGIRQRTHCLWDFLESIPQCKNPNYKPSSKVLLMPLPMLLRSVELWVDRHCLHGPKICSKNPPLPLQLAQIGA